MLRKDDSEVYWRGLKKRISLIFRDARRRGVKDGVWEVWVKEGEGENCMDSDEEGEGNEFDGL